MYKKSLLTLLSCMCLAPSVRAFDAEFFADMEDSFRSMGRRMEHRMSSFFNDDLDATLETVQARIDKMREQFDKLHEHIVEQYESFADETSEKSPQTPLFTVKDEDSIVRVTVMIGDVETDMIENHLEKDALVITAPKNKPTLKIVVYPDTLVITGTKVVEKEQTQEKDKATSHIVSSRSIHTEQSLPTAVVTTENVTITHSADDKTITIELPKKTHKQQFSITKK